MFAYLRQLWTHLRTDNTAPPQMAASVFWGIFLGILPIYGIQTGVIYVTSKALRLNFLTVITVSNIQNPFFAPFWVAAGIALGELVRYGRLRLPGLDEAQRLWDDLSLLGGELGDTFFSMFLGDFIIGIVIGGLCAAYTYWYAERRQRRLSQQGPPDGGPLPDPQ